MMGVYLDQRSQIQLMTEEADRMLRAQQEAYVAALQMRYQEFAERVVNDAKALRSDIMDTYGLSEPNISEYKRFAGDYKIAKAIQDEIRRLNGYVDTDFLNQMRSVYQDSYNANAWVLDESTPENLDINYKLPPEFEMRQFVSQPWSGAMFSQRIGVINDAMARDIQSEVAQSMLSGDSARDLAKRIERVIGDGESDYSYRAKMISRTELLRASNLGRSAIWDENEDIIDDWIWVTRAMMSGRLCDECAERSGKGYDEVQELAIEQEMDGEPPAHPNCACGWMPKVKEWKDLLPPEMAKRMVDMGPTAMVWKVPQETIPSKMQGFAKVEPMEYTSWADEYLDPDERGNL